MSPQKMAETILALSLLLFSLLSIFRFGRVIQQPAGCLGNKYRLILEIIKNQMKRHLFLK